MIITTPARQCDRCLTVVTEQDPAITTWSTVTVTPGLSALARSYQLCGPCADTAEAVLHVQPRGHDLTTLG